MIDVAALPPGAFGYRSLMWWGTMGMVLIEGTAFALAIASYFWFRTHAPPRNAEILVISPSRWSLASTVRTAP